MPLGAGAEGEDGEPAQKRLLRVGIAGQIVSLCLVGTSGSSALLARRGYTMSMLQSFLTYLCIGTFYSGLVLLRQRRGGSDEGGIRGGILTSGMDARMIAVFLVFAVSDVEANFTIVKAYQYTNLTSVTLLDCFTIPCVVCLSAAFLGARYTWVHGAGVVTAVAGLVLLVYTDLQAAEGEQPPSPGNGGKRVFGDFLTLVAATLYAVSNIMQEHLTGIDDWRKVLAGLGIAASGISGLQCLFLEYDALSIYPWSFVDVLLLASYVACLFAIYTLVPQVLMSSGATFLNLSLLTSDFWAVLFGVTVLRERVQWTYFLSFAATVAGIVIYHSKGEPVKGGDDVDGGGRGRGGRRGAEGEET